MSKPGQEKIVVIDPGHGGRDPGAMGPTGLKESEVVLQVALRLEDLLASRGIQVVMTRSDDRFLSLSHRAAIANQVRADLFLSIHCNSAKNPAQGIETFIARKTRVSYPLAEDLQEAMVRQFQETADRGVKRANFTVLTDTVMAAALVELEFIHTVKGERILSAAHNQVKYAKALSSGVLEFLGMKPEPLHKDPEEPKACEPVKGYLATTPADLVEVGQRLAALEKKMEELGK